MNMPATSTTMISSPTLDVDLFTTSSRHIVYHERPRSPPCELPETNPDPLSPYLNK
ncbi:hypothetical protein NC653_036647 [Populus alba x Populus x berolinensis]|uniref:Uncharacterized protein n=1 Tax=Populus alba x Populus x berolinensis TaxID=444605 RepID=A0AAD6LKD2_9ROSI|nr:hypothetical protein NC653_036647 [Populus alba x Populus x berolinensis]